MKIPGELVERHVIPRPYFMNFFFKTVFQRTIPTQNLVVTLMDIEDEIVCTVI